MNKDHECLLNIQLFLGGHFMLWVEWGQGWKDRDVCNVYFKKPFGIFQNSSKLVRHECDCMDADGFIRDLVENSTLEYF